MNDDLLNSQSGNDLLAQRIKELSEPYTTRAVPGYSDEQIDEKARFALSQKAASNYLANNPNASFDDIVSAMRRINAEYYPEKVGVFDAIKMKEEDQNAAAYLSSQITANWMKENPNATPQEAIDTYMKVFGSYFSPELGKEVKGESDNGEKVLASSTSSSEGLSPSYRRVAKDKDAAKELFVNELIENSGQPLYKQPVTYLNETGDLGVFTDEDVADAKETAQQRLNQMADNMTKITTDVFRDFGGGTTSAQENASSGEDASSNGGANWLNAALKLNPVSALAQLINGWTKGENNKNSESSGEKKEWPSSEEQKKVNEYTANQELTEYIKQNPEASDEDIAKAKQTIRETWGVDPTVDISSMRKSLPQPSEEIEYTYKDGDTFGQVLLDLGLSDPTGKDLWGPGGDVEYYTNQLHDQGIWGNIPIGKTIVLKRRPQSGAPSAPDTGAI